MWKAGWTPLQPHDQILSFIRTFPQDIRERLQVLTQSDWRTYQAVLQVQDQIARSPTSLQESDIHFTNVLGEHRTLPYEYFCQWEVCVNILSASKYGALLISLDSHSKVSSAPSSRINPANLRLLMGTSTLSTTIEDWLYGKRNGVGSFPAVLS